MYIYFSPLNSKKLTIQLKRGKRSVQFIKEDMQDMHTKRYSTSTVKEIQIKTTVRFYYTPTRMAKVQQNLYF